MRGLTLPYPDPNPNTNPDTNPNPNPNLNNTKMTHIVPGFAGGDEIARAVAYKERHIKLYNAVGQLQGMNIMVENGWGEQ